MFKRQILAWLFFIVGLAFLFGVDYILRDPRNQIANTGLPEWVWYGFLSAIVILSLTLVWRATAKTVSKPLRLLILVAEAGLGFILYALVCLAYVIETGIDSL